MIIGQETNGWYDNYVDDSEALSEDIAKYKSFRLESLSKTLHFGDMLMNSTSV